MNKRKTINHNHDERLTHQIYNRILSIVHHQGIARTDKLSSINLSQELGISRTPVSFVLYQMELEGIVKNEGKSGWSIKTLSVHELNYILDLEEMLFPYLVRLANSQFNSDDTAKLIIFADEMERCLKVNDLISWRLAEKGYKRLLELSAGNSRLSNFINILDNQLYRLILTYISLKNTNRDIFKVYRDIACAISSGEDNSAEDLAKKYIVDLRKELIQLMKEVVNPLLGTTH